MNIAKKIAIVLGLTAQCAMALDPADCNTPSRPTATTEVPATPEKSENPIKHTGVVVPLNFDS